MVMASDARPVAMLRSWTVVGLLHCDGSSAQTSPELHSLAAFCVRMKKISEITSSGMPSSSSQDRALLSPGGGRLGGGGAGSRS